MTSLSFVGTVVQQLGCLQAYIISYIISAILNTYVLIIDVQFNLHHASPHYPKVDCLKYQGIATDENSYDLDSMGRMYCLRANLADRRTCQKPLCTAFITFYGLAFARCSPSVKAEVKFMHNPNRIVHNRNWWCLFVRTITTVFQVNIYYVEYFGYWS